MMPCLFVHLYTFHIWFSLSGSALAYLYLGSGSGFISKVPLHPLWEHRLVTSSSIPKSGFDCYKKEPHVTDIMDVKLNVLLKRKGED